MASHTSESIQAYRYQEYDQIKSDLLKKNKLFEDPLFPATDESIFQKQPVPKGLIWKRPSQIIKNPKFVVNTYDRNDMDQGQIGNCWFVAAVAGITCNKTLIHKVIPKDQSFTEDYAGIFHFRFWLYGRWVDVCIDDRLPCTSDGRLLFSSNKQDKNEFWCSLLEKAYAKFYGNYEHLIGGKIYSAYTDMSGGIYEYIEDFKTYDLAKQKKFWSILLKAKKMDALMGCAITVGTVKEEKLRNGLISGHAYTITDLIDVGSNLQLIRIRNPWGNGSEWKGDWSDESPIWKNVTESEKKALKYANKPDGEFWMTFNDFIKNWDNLGICHLTPESMTSELEEKSANTEWKCEMKSSSWVAGSTAGGRGEKWWNNPQFLFNLDKKNEESDHKCDVVIALMQKSSKTKHEHFSINFYIYQVKKDVSIPHGKIHFKESQLIQAGSSGSYYNSREICKRFSLSPGNYVVIPSTWYADQESDFLLRIFTEIKKN